MIWIIYSEACLSVNVGAKRCLQSKKKKKKCQCGCKTPTNKPTTQQTNERGSMSEKKRNQDIQCLHKINLVIFVYMQSKVGKTLRKTRC